MAYTNLTVDKLKDLLRARGIRGYSGKRKAELIAMLEGQAVAQPTAITPGRRPATPKQFPEDIDMTVAELKKHLHSSRVHGYSGKSKVELIQMLRQILEEELAEDYHVPRNRYEGRSIDEMYALMDIYHGNEEARARLR